MARPVSDLFNTLGKRPVVIVGGGTSSPDDLDKAPSGAFIVAVNHHCHNLVDPDLAVAMDVCNLNRLPYDCPKVGASEDFDYNIWHEGRCLIRAGINKSAHAAASIAERMTSGRVYLAGIDCYMGGAYWYDPAHTIHRKYSKDWFKIKERDEWARLFRGMVPLSGPLLEVM